jgi:DNA mismatch endonuclease (patch repair protein)
MSRVKGRNTGPEKIVRSILHNLGYRFRIHVRKLPGNPDIVLPRHRKIVLVHGCFWHGHKGCNRSKRPSSNVDFWNKKIDKNIGRDKEVKKELELLGWKVLVVWQCRIRNKEILRERLEQFMNNDQGNVE